MRSNTSSAAAPVSVRRSARRADRRTRRRPVIVAAGVSFGILTAAAFTVTAPVSQAEASGTGASFALASFTAANPSPAATTAAVAVSKDVETARTRAEASLASAATVTADITASGLDIGVPDTSIDTGGLQTAVDRLENAAAVPPPLVPDLTDKVTAQVASVDARVATLRGSLDAAKALKAEQEAAAEKARLEAEAEAAAAAAKAEAAAAQKAAASTTATSAKSSPAAPAPVYAASGGGDNSPGGAQASARAMLGNYGWGDDQFGCLVSLWNRESGWNYQAYNRGSGAYGIPQALPGGKMASAGADWQSNAATQVAWGLGYISGRYGSPCGAWSHSQSTGWY